VIGMGILRAIGWLKVVVVKVGGSSTKDDFKDGNLF
jgi:hypothetical protein